MQPEIVETKQPLTLKEVIVLGCGTSGGVPEIGCDCSVCLSDNPYNKRLRSSVYLRSETGGVLIDTGPDYRMQILRENISRPDAVLYTHSHADHLHGIDDLRNFTWSEPMPLYANNSTACDIACRFSYLFEKTVQKGGGKARVNLHIIEKEPFYTGGMMIVPVPVIHGKLEILGYRIDKFAYLTDCSTIPESSYSLLEGLDVLIINALRYRSHSTHFNIKEALAQIERIAPRQAYLTHMTHDVEYQQLKNELPSHIEPAYDGLRILL